jgi:hypothetical protein
MRRMKGAGDDIPSGASFDTRIEKKANRSWKKEIREQRAQAGGNL